MILRAAGHSQVQWDQVRPKEGRSRTGEGSLLLGTCPENFSEPSVGQELGAVICLLFLPHLGPLRWAWGTGAVFMCPELTVFECGQRWNQGKPALCAVASHLSSTWTALGCAHRPCLAQPRGPSACRCPWFPGDVSSAHLQSLSSADSLEHTEFPNAIVIHVLVLQRTNSPCRGGPWRN